MWNSVKAEMESGGKTFCRRRTPPRKRPRKEYRTIADRPACGSGLVLSEIGEKNKINRDRRRGSAAPSSSARAALDARPREGGLGLLSQQRQCAGPAFVHRSFEDKVGRLQSSSLPRLSEKKGFSRDELFSRTRTRGRSGGLIGASAS